MADFDPSILLQRYQTDDAFDAASKQFGIDPQLLRAVAQTESAGNAGAVSPKGAMGVMQLMPQTAQEMGVTNPNDVRQNIMGGARYLKQQLDKYKDIPTALAAYNAGPGNVDKYGGVPPFQETQDYVKRVMGRMQPQAQQSQATFDPSVLLKKYQGDQSQAKPQAPQEEGFFDKLYNHPVDTLVDNLPVVGGAVGGIVGGLGGGLPTLGLGAAPAGIVGATVGGGLGEAARKTIRQLEGKDDYKTGTVLGDAADIGTQAAIQGATEGAGKLIGAGLQKVGTAAVRRAFGLTKGGEAPQLLEDLIANKVNPNTKFAGVKDAATGNFKGGALEAAANSSRGTADAMVNNAVQNGAKRVSPLDILDALHVNPYDPAATTAEDTLLRSPEGMANPGWRQFWDYQDRVVDGNPTKVDLNRVLDIRRSSGRAAADVLKGNVENPTLMQRLYAGTETGAKKILEDNVPGLAGQNETTARTLRMMEAARDAVESQTNPSVLALRAARASAIPVIGPIADIVANNPTVNAVVGRGLNTTGRAVTQFSPGIATAIRVPQLSDIGGSNGKQPIKKAKVDSLWEQYQNQDQP